MTTSVVVARSRLGQIFWRLWGFVHPLVAAQMLTTISCISHEDTYGFDDPRCLVFALVIACPFAIFKLLRTP